MKAELVTWLDHCEPSNAGNVWWAPEDLLEVTGPAVVKSIGWVIREEPSWLLMVSQITEDQHTDQPLVIVKSCILSRHELDL